MIGGPNIKNLDPSKLPFRPMYTDDDDINVLRDWVFRSKDFSTKVKVE